jgi:hypothetical protein
VHAVSATRSASRAPGCITAAVQALQRLRRLSEGVTSCSAGRTRARAESTAQLLSASAVASILTSKNAS